ncbi:hypothetical protein OsI_00926 [Oryza sativa Indica Group]|uniref:Uncharacterized protein n=1 Tax=Oryza sativa subsp. indica TaxID=39946 RepID=B8AAL4_ORYSI|nr:hypothetical protein OsI_00926 [Oryza sativa Indica Group]
MNLPLCSSIDWIEGSSGYTYLSHTHIIIMKYMVTGVQKMRRRDIVGGPEPETD